MANNTKITKTKSKRSVKAKTNSAPRVKAKIKKVSLAKSAVEVGSAVPSFALPSTGGKTVLSEMLKGKIIVLYFYPRDATPGCTLEGHDFSRLHSQFKKLGGEVYGISRDPMKAHEKFRDQEKYSMDLLSDEKETVCQLFGVIKMKNMYGKQVRGIERSTFVIGRDGKLAKEWRGVKVPGHAEEVLAFVKTL